MRKVRKWIRNQDAMIAVVSGVIIVAAWAVRPLAATLSFWLLTLAAVVAGYSIAQEAWGRLLARQFSISLLVTIAAVGAILIGEAWEAAAVTWLYIFGNFLEGLTLSRTRSALRGLVDLMPRTAKIKKGEELVTVSAYEVKPGDIVVVFPGDSIPVDGSVIAGRAAVDTSSLTGEPMPAEIGPSDQVLSGTISQSGYLEIQAQRVGVDTTFSKLVYLVAEAQEQKPQVQRTLDRFAQWYTPAIIIAAAIVYLVTRNMHLALTFLVIACPGALVVAAPVAIVAGLGNAAKRGILIKGGERLERIAQADVIALDKTGTLTLGQPRVETITGFAVADERVLALAAAAELRSEHHLAGAILTAAQEQGIEAAAATDWHIEAGLGVIAQGPEGEILVGNRRLLRTRGIELTPAQESAIALREKEGETVAIVAQDNRPIGLIGITDPIKSDAVGLIAALKRAGIQRTVMLTGDNLGAAQRVAQELEIEEVQAGLLPEQKVAAVRQLQAAGHTVAMVGDGINDAPAIAAADVSIAMGTSGTQVAMEAADIALIGDRIGQVPEAIAISRRILRVVRQNVAFAVAVVLLLLAGVVAQVVHLGSGMAIHEASILIVTLNGMRLLRTSPAQYTP